MDSRDNYVLVHFKSEDSYAVVSDECVDESDYEVQNDVHIWWGKGRHAKLFPARLICYGTEEECEDRLQGITHLSDESSRKRKGSTKEAPVKKIKAAEPQCSTSGSTQRGTVLEEERQKLLKAVADKDSSKKEQFRLPSQPEPSETTFMRNMLSNIVKRLTTIETKLDQLVQQDSERDETSRGKISPSSRPGFERYRVKPEDDNTDGNDDEVEAEFVYDGIDLLGLKAPPKEPTRYATRIAGVLFSHEELLYGMIPPLSDKGKKVAFQPEKVALLKRCIARKYSQKVLDRHWPDIRRSVNQKGNDLRKKSKAQLSTSTETASEDDPL